MKHTKYRSKKNFKKFQSKLKVNFCQLIKTCACFQTNFWIISKKIFQSTKKNFLSRKKIRMIFYSIISDFDDHFYFFQNEKKIQGALKEANTGVDTDLSKQNAKELQRSSFFFFFNSIFSFLFQFFFHFLFFFFYHFFNIFIYFFLFF